MDRRQNSRGWSLASTAMFRHLRRGWLRSCQSAHEPQTLRQAFETEALLPPAATSRKARLRSMTMGSMFALRAWAADRAEGFERAAALLCGVSL